MSASATTARAIYGPVSAGFVCLLVAVAGWGANWPPTKLLIQEVPVLTARAWPGVAGALVLALALAATGQRLAVPRGAWGRLWGAALLNVTGWMGGCTFAMIWLAASEAVLVCYTMPVWAALLAWPLLGERPTPRRLLALALGVAGVAVIALGRGVEIGLEKLPGVAFGLGAAACLALGTVLMKRWPPPLAPGASVAWQVMLGSLPMVALALALDRPDVAAFSPLAWGAMAYQALVSLGICYLAWFAALRRLPAGIATTGTLLAPLVGVTASALALGEPFGVREAAALALTLGGVALAARG